RLYATFLFDQGVAARVRARSGSAWEEEPCGAVARISEELRTLSHAGRKVDAVKRVRALTGLGLKESKDAVDIHEAATELGVGRQELAQHFVHGHREMIVDVTAPGAG